MFFVVILARLLLGGSVAEFPQISNEDDYDLRGEGRDGDHRSGLWGVYTGACLEV